MEITEAIQAFSDFMRTLLVNNWSLVVTGLAGLILWKVLKSSVHLVFTLVCIGVAVSVLTNMGVLPPIDQMLEGVKSLVS